MIELRGVTKRYGAAAVGADDVSLNVEPGEYVALFGPSGSGKTSILHLMGLLQEPDSGEIWIDGGRVDDLGESDAAAVRRTKLGFVFQSFGLLPLLSAEENVAVGLRLLGVSGSAARRRIDAALEAVDIAHRRDHRPGEMSGGEQQRVAIARALVHAPKVILADEPTGELDTSTAEHILALLGRIAEHGTAVVIASHDPLALDAVGRPLFVRDGKLHEPDRAELELWIREGTARGEIAG